MLNVVLEGDDKLQARLASMPARIRAELFKTVYAKALKLEGYIKQNKLQGQVLGHRSGALWRSIQNKVTQSDNRVEGVVYSSGDVKYAGFWEYGGTIPPHIIEPKRGEALAFLMNGKMVFAKSVQHPGYTAAPRSFMRSGLRDMRDEIIEAMGNAVIRATQT